MERITGNHRIVYQCLQRLGLGGGVLFMISYGTLAIMTGYHRNTVAHAVQSLAANGLLYVERQGRGRVNLYRITPK